MVKYPCGNATVLKASTAQSKPCDRWGLCLPNPQGLTLWFCQESNAVAAMFPYINAMKKSDPVMASLSRKTSHGARVAVE